MEKSANVCLPGAINRGPRRTLVMHGDQHWTTSRWFERPREDPVWPDVHIYADRIAYEPGEEVSFLASTTAPVWRMEICRGGLERRVVHQSVDLAGRFTPVPADSYKSGCGWPVPYKWRLPEELEPGFYVVASSCERPTGGRCQTRTGDST